MKINKKTLALLGLGLFLLPAISLGQTAVSVDPPEIANLTDLVSKVEQVLWIVFGLIAVVMFVIAGILFLTAGGAPEKVQAARSAAIWGVVGVVVGIIAYSIVAIVASFLA